MIDMLTSPPAKVAIETLYVADRYGRGCPSNGARADRTRAVDGREGGERSGAVTACEICDRDLPESALSEGICRECWAEHAADVAVSGDEELRAAVAPWALGNAVEAAIREDRHA